MWQLERTLVVVSWVFLLGGVYLVAETDALRWGFLGSGLFVLAQTAGLVLHHYRLKEIRRQLDSGELTLRTLPPL
jgi:hypothetical protein